MSAIPSDFVDIAKQLLATAPTSAPPHDALWRYIITGAYYGAFLATRDYLHRLTGRVIGGDVHGQARQEILNRAPKLPPDAPESAHEIISDRLGHLIRLRRKAHYDLTFSLAREDAWRVVEMAEEVLREVERLPQP